MTYPPESRQRHEPGVPSPLFSKPERLFNLQLTARLEASGFRVFLPQRDGVDRKTAPYDAIGSEDRRRAMFRLDRQKVLDCDVFLFLLDGRVPDEGACVELGIAHCERYLRGGGKLFGGLHTDTRAAFIGSRLNPMVRVALDYITEDEQALLRLLSGYGTWRRNAEAERGGGNP
ncbi:MAG TPA: nucleoside 2-deoxyribosyltransferase [Rubrobacter sp.]|nr:nucleoside 2-deoxyribosyltransferase [Rubrobacter sp.]